MTLGRMGRPEAGSRKYVLSLNDPGEKGEQEMTYIWSKGGSVLIIAHDDSS